ILSEYQQSFHISLHSSAEWSAVMTDSLTSLHPSAATPLQNDKVLVALRALYGNDAQFQTDEQRDAIMAVATGHHNVIIQLTFAAGKSLAISILAYLDLPGCHACCGPI